MRSKFLPMLCSSTRKEVKLSHRPAVVSDPSSPRVGCMGQVKRNNKVVGFPSIVSFTTSFSCNNNNHSSNAVKTSRSVDRNRGRERNDRHRRTSSMSTITKRDDRHRRTSSMSTITKRDDRHRRTSSMSTITNISDVNLEELDPPLPVVDQKQKQKEKEDKEGSLWKRRSGGVPLKTLQIQTCKLPSANTV